MSTALPTASIDEAKAATVQSPISAWVETVVAVTFTAAGVFFVLIVAVMNGLV
jgi:hypothetical protein